MSDAEFELLAVEVLADEATPAERERLEAELARDTARRQHFEELRAAWTCVRVVGPLAQALEAPATPIPAPRLRQLQAVVREHFHAPPGRRTALLPAWPAWWRLVAPRTAFAVAIVLVLGLCVWYALDRPGWVRPAVGAPTTIAGYLVPRAGTPEVLRAGQPLAAQAVFAVRSADEVRLPAAARVEAITPAGLIDIRGPRRFQGAALAANPRTLGSQPLPPVRHARGRRATASLQTALFQPVAEALAGGLLVVNRGGAALPLYSPRNATASLTPLILWKNRPGQTYDLTITDELNRETQPWRLHGVTSPVQFAQVAAWTNRPLASNGLYRLTLRESGDPFSAGEWTFTTTTDPAGERADTAAGQLVRAYRLVSGETVCLGDALVELLTLPAPFADSPLALRLKLLIFGQLGLPDDFDATAAKLRSAPE